MSILFIRNSSIRSRLLISIGALFFGHAMAQTALEPAESVVLPDLSSPSNWNISGFGTLGAVHQSGVNGWGFVRNRSQRGAGSDSSLTPDSRLGAQLNWSSGPWEAGLQAVALSKPSGAAAAESVTYAYAGWRPLPDTRIRLGRTSPDIFLFADSRNVGYALPWARPPVDFYGFAPISSLDGVDLEQRWFGGAATWRARFTAGSMRTSVSDTDGSRLDMHGRNAWALGLSREEGGLLLKASYQHAQLYVDTNNQADQLRQALNAIGTIPVPGLASSLGALGNNLWTGGSTSYLALAAQYETGPWTFISEGSQLKVPNSPLGARRGYVSVGYRYGPVTYYGSASRVKPDDAAVAAPNLAGTLSPLIGLPAALQAQALAGFAAAAGDSYRFDQSTLSAGLRWDFRSNAALKLQVDRFDVRAHGAAGWRFSDGRAARGTLVSVLVDFVWGQ